MAPRHPVPDGYGSPCEEGRIVTSGTGGRRAIDRYGEIDDINDLEKCRRNARGFEDMDPDTSNIFDC